MKQRSRLILLGILLLIAVLGLEGSLQAASAGNEILLQGFGWNSQRRGSPGKWYSLIAERAQDIAQLGVTHVWFPPVSRSVSPQGYLPGDYYDLGTQEWPTFYGDKDQLAQALQKLRSLKVRAIADIVVNHRCAGKQDANGIWNVYHFPSNKAKWEAWAVCKGQYGGTGAPDTGDSYHAAPDIDHTNATVQEDIVAWMNWLKKVGFAGWRYDYVKGFDARFAGIYDKATGPNFSVGELWTDMSFQGSQLNYDQNHHRQQLCDWLDRNKAGTTIFDFTTKGILQVAVQGEYWRLRDKNGKASGLIGWWPRRAVTFIDNHDTGSQQAHWPFPGDKVMQGYAYILTHPGIPCLFWEHVYDWNLKTQLKKLIDIRKQFGLHAESKLLIEKAEQGLYAAVVDGKVAVKLGSGNWAPPADSFELLASGDNYAVWGKKSAAGTRRR